VGDNISPILGHTSSASRLVHVGMMKLSQLWFNGYKQLSNYKSMSSVTLVL